MNKNIQWIIGVVAILALVLSGIALVGGNNQPVENVGASGTRFPNGISADTTSPVRGQIRGSSLTITTTNTATSTASVGCIQTTATSTATPIRFVIGSSGATTTYQGAQSVGVVGWQFGSCPI